MANRQEQRHQEQSKGTVLTDATGPSPEGECIACVIENRAKEVIVSQRPPWCPPIALCIDLRF